MLVRFGIVGRRPDMTVEAFRSYWRDVHGPLAGAIPGVRRYHQNLITSNRQLRLDIPLGPWHADGFSQIWFDDDAAMRRALAAPAYAANAADIPNFIGDFKLLVCAPNTAMAIPPSAGRLRKRISLLKRRSDISAAMFRDEWIGRHAEIMSNIAGIVGYTQNRIIHRGPDPSVDLPYADLPIDGISELWFRSTEELRDTLHTPAGEALMAHARAFLGEITTFEVEVYPVIDAAV